MRSIFLAGIVMLMAMFQVIQAQIPEAIQVDGWIMLKEGDSEKGLAGVELWVRHEKGAPSKKVTDAKGYFSFKTPKNQNSIRIDIPPNEFAFLDPRDGHVILNPNISLEVKITVVSKEKDEKLYQEIKSLTRKLGGLKLDNKRLNAMYDVLRDSMMDMRQQGIQLSNQVAELEEKLGRSRERNEVQQKELESLKDRLAEREKENQSLREALFVALEEKYLRQQSIYNQISEDLMEYLVRVKDMRDQSNYLPNYYKSDNYNPYFRVVKAYVSSFEHIKKNHKALLEGVNRYWENPALHQRLAQLYDFLLIGLHEKKLMPSFNELNQEIRQRRIKRIKQMGQSIEASLSPDIYDLEKMIAHVLDAL